MGYGTSHNERRLANPSGQAVNVTNIEPHLAALVLLAYRPYPRGRFYAGSHSHTILWSCQCAANNDCNACSTPYTLVSFQYSSLDSAISLQVSYDCSFFFLFRRLSISSYVDCRG